MSLWRDITYWEKWIVENFIDISTPTFYHQSTLENELINSFKNYNIFLLKNLQNINPNCSIATYALARVFGKNISQKFSTLFITLINTFLPRFGVLLTVEKGVFLDVVWMLIYVYIGYLIIKYASSHICASGEGSKRALFTSANEWDLPLGIGGSQKLYCYLHLEITTSLCSS